MVNKNTNVFMDGRINELINDSNDYRIWNKYQSKQDDSNIVYEYLLKFLAKKKLLSEFHTFMFDSFE